MLLLPDANIFIHIANDYMDVRARFALLPLVSVAMSALTVAELEAGIVAIPAQAVIRERLLRPMLEQFPHLPFTSEAASLYGQIIRETGYSRRKALDRMLAAQALALNATVITANADDFADIKGLKFEAW